MLVFIGLRLAGSSLMMLWHWLTLISSLIFACHNFVERNAPKKKNPGGVPAASCCSNRFVPIGRASWFETRHLIDPGAHQFSWTSCPQKPCGSFCLFLFGAMITDDYHSSKYLTLDSQACMADTSPTELSLQPLRMYLFLLKPTNHILVPFSDN